MKQKRIYYPLTTAQQRKFLFERWKATGNVTQACHESRTGRSTFYYWKPRFEKEGYAGLEEFKKQGPRKAHRKASETEQRVMEVRQENPKWGKRRIAEELAKANNWVPVVSPNTVRRILRDAGLWQEPPARGKKG